MQDFKEIFDALGRETNTVVYAGAMPGEATNFLASAGKALSAETTAYPNGGSDYAVHTDARGKVTISRTDILGGCIERGEAVFTNGVEVVRTKSLSYFGGGLSTRREWDETDWTEEKRFTVYAADGRRIDYVVTESHGCGTVTNSIAVYDWLGRLVSSATPLGVTTFAYDGATSRTMSALYEVGDISRLTTYVYDAQGERCGSVLDGVTRRTDVSYDVVSGIVWRVTHESTVGPSTNAATVIRERVSGLGNGLVSRVETAEENGPSVAEEKTRDEVTGVVTETRTSTVALPSVTRRQCGLLLDQEDDGTTRYYTYDSFGRNVRVEREVGGVSGRFPVSESAYDAYGDLIVLSVFTNGTDVVTETYGYDSFGRKVLSVNALGVVTATGYDANGNVVSEEGASYPVRFAYDSQGRRVSMQTNRSGDTWDETRWTYDPSTGLCTSKTYEDGSVVLYEFTPDGLLETTRTADGHWMRNVYDAKRQVVGVCYDGGNDVAYVRDVYGRETLASNAVAAYAFKLERSGVATNEAVTIAGIAQSLRRSADQTGRLVSFGIDGDYADQSISYRADGRIDCISNVDAVVTYSHAADGRETGYALALLGGVVFTRSVTRDPYRRDLVLNVANAIGEDYGYSYDALSRPVTRNADAFQYNDRSEVIGASAAGQTEGYSYDNIGNAIWASVGVVTNVYTSNGLNQYTTVGCATPSVPSVQLAYDAEGNLISFGDWSYVYDSAARLTEVRSNGVLVASNDYDHKGRRVRKVTSDASYTFFYDGWNVVLELVKKGGTTDRIEYYWGKDISDTFQGAGGIGGLLYLKRNGSIYVPIYDAYGNVMEYRATDGSLAASYVYDAFGRMVSQTGALAEAFRFRHATKSFESETGLYYYGYRFYNPLMRRWLTRDPLEEQGGLNVYAYCRNSAVLTVDVNGLAYFAVRGLGGGKIPIVSWSTFFSCPFMKVVANVVANAMNIEILHEQMFFEDGSNVGWGNDEAGSGEGAEITRESPELYYKRDGGYNDCIMHLAVEEVHVNHYQVTWIGGRTKCNCQDYADMLRKKYYELVADCEVRCKCGLK